MKPVILLTMLFLAGCASVFAQQPKTVTDFYLAMPNDRYLAFVDGRKTNKKAEVTKYRKSLIKIEDIKNGYLKLEGDWEGWAEITLFKRKDGSYLIAETGVGCGPACAGNLTLSTYSNGKWTDVTKQFAPKVTSQTAFDSFKAKGGIDEEYKPSGDFPFYFLLPQFGKTLKIACDECSGNGGEFILVEYEWNGDKFVKK